jgi:carboxypeptidase T
MKRFVLLAVLTAATVMLAMVVAIRPAPAGDQAQFDYPVVVVRAYFEDRQMVADLAAWKEPWEVDYNKGFVVVDVTPAEYDLLEAAGFRLEIDRELTLAANEPRQSLPGQVSGIPGYPCYRTVEETFTSAAGIALNYPQLAAWIDIGDSWEKTQDPLNGYDLNVLRLTNSAIPGPKPKLFIMSSIHAREYAPAELSTRFGEYLVQNYGTNPDITWLLDYHEVHLLLQSNPDGRKRAETGLSWRKNTNNNYCTNTNNRGADLNRNFEFQWGCCGGGSNNQCDLTYRGPSPASEPEVTAVQAYVRSQFPDQRDDPLPSPAPDTATGVFMDMHSYGQLVLWPWGFTTTVAPNGPALQTLGRKFAYHNNYFPEQAIGLYPTDGTTDDFGYGDLGLAAYTFELGTSFFQSCGTFENTIVPANLPAMLYAAKAARTPYMTPAGPDAVALAVDNNIVAPGQPVHLTATADDTRFNNVNGTEPVQNIAAAEYYIDVPPWVTDTVPVALPMTAVDGSFNSPVEAVQATVDTTGLASGRYTLYVRGQDAAAEPNWGAVSAIFLYVIDPDVAPTIGGQVTAADTGLPLAATIDAGGLFYTSTNPATGQFAFQVISGTYNLTAAPASPNYAPSTASGVVAHDYQTVQQDFVLYPYCDVFTDDVESGAQGWTAQAPWAITTESSHSPTHSWTDSPGGQYGNNRNISLTSAALDLTGYEAITLDFWQICDTEAGYDYCHVEVSTNGGTDWDEVALFDGPDTTWDLVSLSLPALDNQPDVRLRFRFTSDGGVTRDGWHLDDIRLRAAGEACLVPTVPTAGFTSSSPDTLGQTTVFTNTSTGTNLTFVWDFGDGSPTSTEANPSHLYTAAGLYTVTLVAENTLGTDSFSAVVEIVAPPVTDHYLFLPTIFVPANTTANAPPVADRPR